MSFQRFAWLWPLIVMIGGVALLLDNFLLVDVNLSRYWPVLLLALGLQLLVRGDIALSWQTHTFGITRGSVESASIEIESGELDTQLRALRKPGRLIAGQYTARSRPGLTVRNNHATLRMRRGQTWWLSLADWDVGLATDLPWSVLVSSYLGRLDVDLRGLLINRAYVSSGLGSVQVACPRAASGPVWVRSVFGDARLTIPPGSVARIAVRADPFGRVRFDPARFELIKPGVYVSVAAETSDDGRLDLDIVASTVFGSIHIT
jgi:hypothetical protein